MVLLNVSSQPGAGSMSRNDEIRMTNDEGGISFALGKRITSDPRSENHGH